MRGRTRRCRLFEVRELRKSNGDLKSHAACENKTNAQGPFVSGGVCLWEPTNTLEHGFKLVGFCRKGNV